MEALWSCWCCNKADQTESREEGYDGVPVRKGIISPASVFNDGNAYRDNMDQDDDGERMYHLEPGIRELSYPVAGRQAAQWTSPTVLVLIGLFVLVATALAVVVFNNTGTGTSAQEGQNSSTATDPTCLQPCKCLRADTSYAPPGAVLANQCPGIQLQSCLPPPGPDPNTPFSETTSATCHDVNDGKPSVQDIVQCLGGTASRPPAYLVVGEEKAAALVPGLRLAIAPRQLYYSTWIQGTMLNGNLYDALAAVVQPGDVVVFSLNQCHEWASFNFTKVTLVDEYGAIAARLQQITAERMASVLLVASNPAPTVVARSISSDQAQAFVQKCRDEWAKLTGPNIVTMEFQQFLCDSTACTKFIPGTTARAVSGWEGLLTTTASQYLAPFFCSELMKNNLLDAPAQAI